MSRIIEYTVKVYSNGTKEWFLHGKLHREDGPAVEYVDGDKYWYLNGTSFTEKEFNAKMNPVVKEFTVREIENLLGYSIKVVK